MKAVGKNVVAYRQTTKNVLVYSSKANNFALVENIVGFSGELRPDRQLSIDNRQSLGDIKTTSLTGVSPFVDYQTIEPNAMQ